MHSMSSAQWAQVVMTLQVEIHALTRPIWWTVNCAALEIQGFRNINAIITLTFVVRDDCFFFNVPLWVCFDGFTTAGCVSSTHAHTMSQLICTNIVQIVTMFITIYYPVSLTTILTTMLVGRRALFGTVSIQFTFVLCFFFFGLVIIFFVRLNKDNAKMKNWRIFLLKISLSNVNRNRKSDVWML